MSFLKPYSTTKNNWSSHTCMNSSQGGRFFVAENFLSIFNKKCFENFSNGIKMYLSERVPPKNSGLPFKFFIDVDFNEKCKNIPELREIVETCIFILPNSDDCIISIRGNDKLHIVFPSIIVVYKEALDFYEKLLSTFTVRFSSFENEGKGWKSSLDKSVYTSGLRMMTSVKPKKDNRPDHYTIMDFKTWEPVELTLDLLNKASIYVPHTIISKKEEVKEEISDLDTSLSFELISPSDMFFKYFKAEYGIRKRLSKAQVSEGNLIIPLLERWCFIADREHKSNHPYIVINSKGSKFKCHDETCIGKEYKPVDQNLFPLHIRKEYNEMVDGKPKDVFMLDEKMLILAKKECEQNMTHYFPKSDIDSVEAIKDMMVSNLQNFYLPCQRCGNDKKFIAETNSEGLCLRCSECLNQWPERRMPVPSRYETLNNYLFQVNVTINNIVNVNNYGVQDLFIGDYCNDGLTVFEDSNLNSIFLASLDTGSDNKVARLLLALYGGKFHCTADKEWFHFNGQYWHSGNNAKMDFYHNISDSCHTHFTTAINFYKNSDIQDETTKQKRKHIQKIIERLESAKYKDSILKESVSEFHHSKPQFKNNLNRKNLIVFNNGVYDFEDLEFREGRQDDYMTMTTMNDYIPYDEDDPKIKIVYTFLNDILPDKDVLDYTMKVLGLSLTLDISQQFFWIFTGGGGNGKSMLFNLLEKSLGEYYGTASPTFLTRKREDANQANEALTSLELARCCVITEAESKDTIQVGLMKQLTGSDTVTSRKNYGTQLKFKPKFKLFFVCNDIPDLSENQAAVWRRVKVINFPVKFVENPIAKNERKINVKLSEDLDSCSSAFLSILIHYYNKYKKEGLSEPEAIQSATSMYKNESDLAQNFYNDCLDVVNLEDEFLTDTDFLQWSDLYKQVKIWATSEFGIQEKAMPKRTKLKEDFIKILGEPVDSSFSRYQSIFPRNRNSPKIIVKLRGWKTHKFSFDK